MVDVALLHGIVFGVFTLAHTRLGGLAARFTILGNQRTEILRLGILALRRRTPLAGSRLRSLLPDRLLVRIFLLIKHTHAYGA